MFKPMRTLSWDMWTWSTYKTYDLAKVSASGCFSNNKNESGRNLILDATALRKVIRSFVTKKMHQNPLWCNMMHPHEFPWSIHQNDRETPASRFSASPYYYREQKIQGRKHPSWTSHVFFLGIISSKKYKKWRKNPSPGFLSWLSLGGIPQAQRFSYRRANGITKLRSPMIFFS